MQTMKLIISTIAFLALCCSAQITEDDKNTILKLHNDARATASPTPQTPLQPLVWDNAIAADTQSWVSQCKQNYSPKYYGTVYGENPIILNRFDIPTGFNSWFGQKPSFNFADASCSASNCKNFQQIVSNTATSIGCAVATCSWGVFFVCNYKAYTQYTGVLPYIPVTGEAPPTPPVKPIPPPPTTSGYETIDYRGTTAVVAARDQKKCGDCWAFSTAAIIEGVFGMQGAKVSSLSDQNVLDCSGGGSCEKGGWPPTALKGMIKLAGINTDAEYPYKVVQGPCAYNAATSQGKITKSGQTKGDFDSIYKALVQYGPVGIAVFADDDWYSYSSGVIAKDYTSVNHAVTVVGYDKTLDAWIVKNSWGPTWGMNGFLYISASRPSGAQLSGAFWAQ